MTRAWRSIGCASVSRPFVAALVIAAAAAAAIPLRAQQKLLSFDDIYDPGLRVNFSGSPSPDIRWIDGSHYAIANRGRGGSWLKVDAANGAESPLFDTSRM